MCQIKEKEYLIKAFEDCFDKQLKEIRTESKLTISDVANAVGVSVEYLKETSIGEFQDWLKTLSLLIDKKTSDN